MYKKKYFFFLVKYFQRDDEYDVRLLIHQSLAGCIIGKGGQKIKEIRDVSNPLIMIGSSVLLLKLV